MQSIIISGVHGVGKTTISKSLYNFLKLQGFEVRLYSNDNYGIYRKSDTFSNQIDRLYFGQKKIKEAIQESPQIAIFDRDLIDNIIYSRCFNRFNTINQYKYITNEQLLSLVRIYQMILERQIRLQSTIFFLNPPIERILENIKERNSENGSKRENGTILKDPMFIQCLKSLFEDHYQYYIESPIFELNEYNDTDIITILKENDVIQLKLD
ncbi:MAG: deoxynucleoside kinase [Acidithiobacillus sp.]|jgi:deoxyadenosine/deoxycytidine kinase|uniref:deoxynucleoside kinase n=1 Tax=Acidithiobacillus sp. TaxID=1872118 RepID=UPI0035602770